MSPQRLWVKEPLKMEAKLSSDYDWKKIRGEKQNKFFIPLFTSANVAAKWQLLTHLFRKNGGENYSRKG